MAELVLFHSALGLRPAVRAWADALRGEGHVVHTPDLFDGQVFDTLDAGVAAREAIGIPELSRRAHAAVEGLPAGLIYAGFSMGAASAMDLALTRPGARGLFMMHGMIPPAAFGVTAWPALPVALHTAADDPWVPPFMRAQLEALAPGAVTTYPGEAHLFADPDLAEHQPEAAAAMGEALRAFLAAHG